TRALNPPPDGGVFRAHRINKKRQGYLSCRLSFMR
ncbi:IS200/IS605 family transposase, partial [Escherichia coli]